jgi:transposase
LQRKGYGSVADVSACRPDILGDLGGRKGALLAENVSDRRADGAPSMGKSITDLSSVTTVGLDLAKHVFQVHAIGAFGRVIVAKALRRKDVLAFFAQLPECLVGMEACGSAHHWARELIKLGHDARMMPPAYVKPYGAPRRRVLPVEEESTQRVVD